MSKDSTMFELEMRIAFIEDQCDSLNREISILHRDNNRLNKELLSLAKLIRPLIQQESYLDAGSDAEPPPPHY